MCVNRFPYYTVSDNNYNYVLHYSKVIHASSAMFSEVSGTYLPNNVTSLVFLKVLATLALYHVHSHFVVKTSLASSLSVRSRGTRGQVT